MFREAPRRASRERGAPRSSPRSAPRAAALPGRATPPIGAISLGLALACVLAPSSALASEPESAEREYPRQLSDVVGLQETKADSVELFIPTILTSFNAGSWLRERRPVLGGDLLIGQLVMIEGFDSHYFAIMPTVGASAWRALDRPSRLRAYSFTARLDLGFFAFPTLQGFTVSGAGRVGAARGLERGSSSTLYGAQVAATWWPLRLWVGLECQANFTHHLGAWHSDLRFAFTLNIGKIVQLLSYVAPVAIAHRGAR